MTKPRGEISSRHVIKISVESRIYQRLEAIAERKRMEVWRLCQEVVWAYAVERPAAVRPTMPDHHYTARHGQEVGDA
jgi:hypothetical protein